MRRYLAELSGEELNEEDSFRSQEIFAFTINLDYIGDILANILTEFAATRAKQGQSFAQQEFDEISSMHAEVVESLNLGLAVFLRGEELTARRLVARKALIWQMEVRQRSATSCASSKTHRQNGAADDFHLDLRDLKRIHSHRGPCLSDSRPSRAVAESIGRGVHQRTRGRTRHSVPLVATIE